MAETDITEPKELRVIKFSGSWADEFTAEGLKVVEKEWWESHQLEAKEKWGTEERETYFGTNECFTFYNSADYLRNFKVVDLTQDEIQVIQKVIGKYGLGIVPFIKFDD